MVRAVPEMNRKAVTRRRQRDQEYFLKADPTETGNKIPARKVAVHIRRFSVVNGRDSIKAPNANPGIRDKQRRAVRNQEFRAVVRPMATTVTRGSRIKTPSPVR